jgi:hypothetical protein
MVRLQEFQAAAHESGFVDVRECNEGTVLWLKREIPDMATQTRERICMDSLTASVTVYWTSNTGKPDSKTFRTASDLREWFALAS